MAGTPKLANREASGTTNTTRMICHQFEDGDAELFQKTGVYGELRQATSKETWERQG
jgi:hypothetical protein